MDELPPLPWSSCDHPVFDRAKNVYDQSGRLVATTIHVAAEMIVRSVNALADPDVLALAEHLNAMDPLQRGAALDEIRHAIGDW